jgi:adenosylcobinamide kinase/adenosylcobinamide-phosphate guanylyltransferase
LPPLTLILGGARSGKSRYAERLVEDAAVAGTYCATAEAGDAEMAARIAAHRSRRGAFWRTVETPLALAATIGAEANPDRPLLIDCLTLWLSNLMLTGGDIDEATDELLEVLGGCKAPVVFVSNEVGLGVVPDTPLGRVFRDAQGRLNMRLAERADRVILLTAGLPLVMKDRPGRLSPS